MDSAELYPSKVCKLPPKSPYSALREFPLITGKDGKHSNQIIESQVPKSNRKLFLKVLYDSKYVVRNCRKNSQYLYEYNF